MFTVHNLGRNQFFSPFLHRLHALYSIGVPSLYRYHGENVFVRGFPLHRAGCVPGTALSGHSGGTTRLERWRRKSLSSILVCKAIDGHFYTRSGSHCCDTFSVILVYVYRVGRKRGHKLVATIQSNLNRFSFFHLKILQKICSKVFTKIPPHVCPRCHTTV